MAPRSSLEKRKITSHSLSPSLCITYVPTASVKLNPKNPRLHTDKQVGQIARSIQAFGFSVPIAIDSNLTVIAGHGRVLAAKLLDIYEIPTVCL
jgi:ParB-like chromosome segregation protein Spo0J